MVRQQQIKRLNQVKADRDNTAVSDKLKKLKQGCETDKENLLSLAIEAARARATLGEISDTLGSVFGRHEAQTQTISGVYGSAFMEDDDYNSLQQSINSFSQKSGRRPRILVAKLGQDGHDRGAKIIATALADIGFDVDISPLFQTPEEIVRQAVDNDVHMIGISTQAGGHTTLVPRVIELLALDQASDIHVICGGVIPSQDYDSLYEAGVKAIFGPGSHIPEVAAKLLKIMESS